eukprot:CAMPEP_0205943406 /NCGR_PEP_ID=MMETSP1325-20131115/60412_1 /ASSEMBLY_ACC=CAM_ASM_000708 /TAXON_ID=236786 /ORGANISM="Florenciella sp., Strain RCC1007" /LENGTH=151 /DNA_ID=CAMNT_0053314215 /DNA_START=382 /DNA_END=838 /DNA_ORIENTATION=+
MVFDSPASGVLDVQYGMTEPIIVRPVLSVLDAEIRVVERVSARIKALDYSVDCSIFRCVKEAQVVVAQMGHKEVMLVMYVADTLFQYDWSQDVVMPRLRLSTAGRWTYWTFALWPILALEGKAKITVMDASSLSRTAVGLMPRTRAYQSMT